MSVSEMSITDTDRLEDLERLHEEHRIKAVDALRKIHDEGLYKLRSLNWDAYAEKRFGYKKTYTKYLLDFARLREQCRAEGIEVLPENENHARPILQAAANAKRTGRQFDAVNAWEIAVDKAPKQNDVPQITASHVQATLGNYGGNGAKSKPKADAELRKRLETLADCAALSSMNGDEFVQKYGFDALGPRFRAVIDWMIEADQAR